jgi:hypothetical protein
LRRSIVHSDEKVSLRFDFNESIRLLATIGAVGTIAGEDNGSTLGEKGRFALMRSNRILLEESGE